MELDNNEFHNIIMEASYYVMQGKSRESAYSKSKELHEERKNSNNYIVRDEDSGLIEYNESYLIEPSFDKNNYQIKAIYKELYNLFEYDL